MLFRPSLGWVGATTKIQLFQNIVFNHKLVTSNFFSQLLSYPSSMPTTGQGDAEGSSVTQPGSTFTVQGVELDRQESRKARVLYDYDAENENELTVYTDQV